MRTLERVPTTSGDDDTPLGAPPARKRSSLLRIALLVAALVAAVWFGGHWALYDRFRVTTDDAIIDTDQVMTMSRINERVASVLVDANQRVRRGQTLVLLDDADERARLALALENRRSLQASALAASRAADLEGELQHAQMRSGAGSVAAAEQASALTAAQAQAATQTVSVARAQVDAARADVRTADAAVPAAADALRKAQADRTRTEDLSREGYVSASAVESAANAVSQAQSAFDAARAQSEAARVKVRTAEAQLAQAQANADAAQSAVSASQAQVPVAQGKLEENSAPSRVLDKRAVADAALANAAATDAQLRIAQHDLEATRIISPIDGWVSARNVEPGQMVSPGQALITISPANRLFVTANYKETQLSRVRAGAPVEISVDACRGQTFKGTVIGLAPVAQSALSTLPTLTAPSNFVKVAQRVPVRISLPRDSGSCVFRPGMSVETSVLSQ